MAKKRKLLQKTQGLSPMTDTTSTMTDISDTVGEIASSVENLSSEINEPVPVVTETITQPEPISVTVETPVYVEPTPVSAEVLLIPNDKLASGYLQQAFDTIVNPVSNMPQITNAYVVFYNAITRVLLTNKNEEDVFQFLTNVCNFIKQHTSDAFSAKKAYRWFDSLPGLSHLQAKEFHILLQVLVDYANNPTMVINQLNWEKVTESLLPKTANALVEQLQQFINSKK